MISNRPARRTLNPLLAILTAAILVSTACSRRAPAQQQPWMPPADTSTPQITHPPTRTPFMPPTRVPGAPVLTPTPDAAHPVPTVRVDPQQYMVQSGDTLGKIAIHYNVSLDELIQANRITDPNRIEVGETLTIPAPTPQAPGSSFKIIPDSELVNGQAAADFDIGGFVRRENGYLNAYRGEAEKEDFSGAEIVARVARDYSVNPRLLLAVLEYQGGWLTKSSPDKAFLDYPLGLPDPTRSGLYKQVAYAANQLNRGFYLWRVNGIASWLLTDGSIIPVSPVINAGTAGVQYLFSQLLDKAGWDKAVSPQGLYTTYQTLFGFPFDYAIEPLLPAGLVQPPLQLPFEEGVLWSFTGGPHGGWGDNSAWAALDFAPPGEVAGCQISEAWAAAVSPGLIVRSDHGIVIEDLDGDGLEQTGWTILYLHVDTQDRVKVGAQVKAGDHIGHPSCEGGVSNATHLHLARRYNGEWIPADGPLPFNLDGWISKGTGNEYDGFLTRDGTTIEADNSRKAENQIQR